MTECTLPFLSLFLRSALLWENVKVVQGQADRPASESQWESFASRARLAVVLLHPIRHMVMIIISA